MIQRPNRGLRSWACLQRPPWPLPPLPCLPCQDALSYCSVGNVPFSTGTVENPEGGGFGVTLFWDLTRSVDLFGDDALREAPAFDVDIILSQESR